MNIHEYQAKALLKKFGLPVTDGIPIFSVTEAITAFEELHPRYDVLVMKSQIHAGGRGAGHFLHDSSGKGGVRLVRTAEEAKQAAEAMYDQVLVTKQTGSVGKQVQRLYLEGGVDIAKEFYLSIVLDRNTSWVAIVASKEGGMDIEKVAETNPEAIVTVKIDPVTGISGFHIRAIQSVLGLSKEASKELGSVVHKLYLTYFALDASLIEINPLVLTKDDHIYLLDAKISLEDNGLERHSDLIKLRDMHEEDQREIEAKEIGLSYIKLDGNIGCMVNGAGLAMATMDMIKLKGGQPANFLDVGGSADEDMIEKAIEIITSDPNVKGIFVNIFGGIMRCDIVARGLIQASKKIGLHIPLVVRLQGTNVELGSKLLKESGLPMTFEGDLNAASEEIVRIVGK